MSTFYDLTVTEFIRKHIILILTLSDKDME